MNKINFDKPILFCDESGFSGNIKLDTDHEKYLRQPLFVVASILINNEKEYREIENIYTKFLLKHKFTGSEFKEEMFSKKNNHILADFIDLIIEKDFWFFSVIDKTFDICNDALYLLFPNSFDEKSYGIYEAVQLNRDKIDFIVKEYFELLKSLDLSKYYKNITKNIDFGPYYENISQINLESNFKIFIQDKKYAKFHHLESILYLFSMVDNDSNFLSLDILKKYNVYYDNNEEFQRIKTEEHFLKNFISEINFLESENYIILQFADNIARLLNRYFKYILFENKDELAEKIFSKMGINYFGKGNFMMYSEDQKKFMNSGQDFRDVIDSINFGKNKHIK
ncbi:DUF3800 domain-containing protein [Spiroplasma alleghenense]|uniref:DUF3800 domain-containing protein n=1 Tax=Spiroplasma alleghenense TaxID=216931 RepID=A0A345Z4V2_9MOLU|nr:DUF3800 domain-containing protein [Spiroplasma alleghenense]AXK51631.1 hypothetical protein SALLE_v1c09610 [Spiroplasma alleghenense]